MEAPPLAPKKIMLIGDSTTEGPDSNASYRRYLDGMLRRSGHLIDLIGSRKKHHDDKQNRTIINTMWITRAINWVKTPLG